jgi:uncharacterized protein YndB with AHSA1/START domain
MMINENTLSASIVINKAIDTVWELWTQPAHIAKWNSPSAEWTNNKIENELRVGSSFLFAMAKIDGSEKFDFKGIYTEIVSNKRIAYTLDDGRKTLITFSGDKPVTLTENFEPVAGLDFTMQQEFCQSVLNKFKDYAEQL